ncbi:hypothetical protein NITMOv2_4711 [Nitrospira moscoviensis]|uniref:Uncharacterized protein n=1 Tax=Nitrospira moscoviensis TaxID=42253 RepID=A0A0K2G7E7_NITMO|nr:hypothetical protein NITMOv2_0070 [Nitrospira moscoviensis]ALA61080.1 hypothetical protein NITMOv2_4711 [Nitrospira moscoviensis]
MRSSVSGLMSQGGNVPAVDQLWDLVWKKIRKHARVRLSLVPLVTFLYEDDLLHMSRKSVEWVSFWSWQVRFRLEWSAPRG